MERKLHIHNRYNSSSSHILVHPRILSIYVQSGNFNKFVSGYNEIAIFVIENTHLHPLKSASLRKKNPPSIDFLLLFLDHATENEITVLPHTSDFGPLY